MGFHTYDPENADRLEDAAFRYRHCSVEELLGPIPDGGTVVDLGSGTGFYTDDVAKRADRVHAVDVQEAMHDRYREKGVPENVDLVTADAADLPFPDDEAAAVVSTMTYHEFYGAAALFELRRVLRPEGRLVLADWSADGAGESGPPTDERYGPDEVRGHLDAAGFVVERLDERPETWFLVAASP
ncbi:class I SAM-dependent methyltransferase [Halostella sp. JP-L12]|uniref:class I SAM-dependent methyltransferase n=1 Tax=Halostella TaxID=1843185 RepID=UPI000EF7930F|nr:MULTISPECIES: class I SAM-dependent methyltransferase [Halostella]NHN48425.1 class I SAM-dependent methyltransferase [Halostella sp. JP-L12]